MSEISVLPQIPNNLNGCSVRVATRNWPPFILSPFADDVAARIDTDAFNVTLNDGIEIKTMNMIAQKLNFKPIYVYDF